MQAMGLRFWSLWKKPGPFIQSTLPSKKKRAKSSQRLADGQKGCAADRRAGLSRGASDVHELRIPPLV